MTAQNWFRLNIEIEMRNDFELPKIPVGRNTDEFWWNGLPLETVLTTQWINEYADILKVKHLTIFYWREGFAAEKTHIDWQRRWGINWVTEPDGRLMTWYNEIPTNYYTQTPPEDNRAVEHMQKNYGQLTAFDELELTDQLCFDSGVNQLHLLRTDVPHHMGIGQQRFAFSLTDYIDWDHSYVSMVLHLKKNKLLIPR